MPRIAYEPKTYGPAAEELIRVANAICREYAEQGYELTLRQLYYQFVARDVIPNNLQSYGRLGRFVDQARLCGELDWNHIVDRMRYLSGTTHWDTPENVIDSAAYGFRIDKWTTQRRRVEIWVEKDALSGIVGRVATETDVDHFACRGYVSQSAMWRAAQRFLGYIKRGQGVTVLYLGDHDPSGLDMTRDVRDRLTKFVNADWVRANLHLFPGGYAEAEEILDSMRNRAGWDGEPLEVRRIALNRDQVDQYEPPPNPAKLTDSRSGGYVAEHGDESWELDALDPSVLADLMRDHVLGIRDEDAYNERAALEETGRRLLNEVAQDWDGVVDYIENRS